MRIFVTMSQIPDFLYGSLKLLHGNDTTIVPVGDLKTDRDALVRLLRQIKRRQGWVYTEHHNPSLQLQRAYDLGFTFRTFELDSLDESETPEVSRIYQVDPIQKRYSGDKYLVWINPSLTSDGQKPQLLQQAYM